MIDVTLEGQVVARGQLVVVGDHFGMRITELAPQGG
jgi:flagellar motor switch/type III secretory pathway protein FliN